MLWGPSSIAHSTLLRILYILPHWFDPTTSLTSEQFKLRWRKLLIRKETVLQTPHVRGVAFDDTNWTSAFRAHGPLHWLAAPCVVVCVGVMTRARDADFVFRNHKGERSDAARSAFAGCAMAHQSVEFG